MQNNTATLNHTAYKKNEYCSQHGNINHKSEKYVKCCLKSKSIRQN